MAQKPLTKNQAKVAFLAQANHFTRLGKPSKIDTELLLNSLSALLAIHGQKVGFKFEGDAAGDFEPTPELSVALEKYMPQMRNLVDVSAQPVTLAKSVPVQAKDATHLNLKTGTLYKAENGAAYYFSPYDNNVWLPFDATAHDLDVAADVIRLPKTRNFTPKPTRPEPIESLSLSVRAQHLLLSDGILTIPDLVNKTESDLLRIKGLGKKSLAEIVEALKRHIGGQAA